MPNERLNSSWDYIEYMHVHMQCGQKISSAWKNEPGRSLAFVLCYAESYDGYMANCHCWYDREAAIMCMKTAHAPIFVSRLISCKTRISPPYGFDFAVAFGRSHLLHKTKVCTKSSYIYLPFVRRVGETVRFMRHTG